MNGVSDMFLPREWTIDWTNAHCMARFGVTPRPHDLVDLWGFTTDALPRVTSHMIFTNGLTDGWSGGGELGCGEKREKRKCVSERESVCVCV
jgi:hypothetical protein